MGDQFGLFVNHHAMIMKQETPWTSFDGRMSPFLFIGAVLSLSACFVAYSVRARQKSLRSLQSTFAAFGVLYAYFLMRMNLQMVHQGLGHSTGGLPMDRFIATDAAISATKQTDASPRDSATNHVLVIASVPRSQQHVASLWSQLECFTKDMDRVIVASPAWARNTLVEPIVQEAQEKLQTRQNSLPHVDTVFLSKNMRYDVGLWCEALASYRDSVWNATSVTLINDSVFAIRSTTNRSLDTLEYIQRHLNASSELDMASLSYHDYKVKNSDIWLESVLRTFSNRGIRKFMTNICEKKFQCGPRMGEHKFKRCVVEKYEVGFIERLQSNRSSSIGLYPALPDRLRRAGHVTRAWSAGNQRWWQQLVDKYDFPIQKVVMADSIPAQCTTKLDLRFLKGLSYTMPPKPCRRLCPDKLNKIHTKQKRRA